MIIRQAVPADLEMMGDVAREFISSSIVTRGFDHRRFIATWSVLLVQNIGVIFLLEDENGSIRGAISGIATPDVNSGELQACEMFWFVSKESRGQGLDLYRRFEQWARDRGCTILRMMHLIDSMPEKLQAVYRRLGFYPVEIHYAKEL